MRRSFLLLLFLCFFLNTQTIHAQTVGLVFSGGGAKGMTHIGVIKALEENDIPIDYIAGTSMGAIVGGMYAMGMTPDEMIELLKSESFAYWSTGQVEQKYIYYYQIPDPNPAFLEMNFQVDFGKKLDSIRIKPSLPTNFISPIQMNSAFMELFLQANTVADGNFDKLFVPFRCVASDVYEKKAVVFKDGDLGDAIRASMTFPFVFKPIMIDNRILYDGGIFNNFPVDVMQEDFHPDFILGSVVASEPEKPTLDNVYLQLQMMIMGHTNYSIPEEEGIVLNFDMKNEGTFDFSKVDDFVELGYNSTMAQMDEIKKHVTRRISQEELTKKRTEFTSRFPELLFEDIYITGIDSLQQKYVRRVFENNSEVFGMEEFKDSYFSLMADDKISEIIPHGVYNPEKGNYDLHLNVHSKGKFKAMLGGNISSTTSNQAYVGLMFQNVTEFALRAQLDAQFGRIYNGLGLGARFDIASKHNLYLKADMVFHKYDYYENNRFFYDDNKVSAFTQNEMYGKIRVGLPLTLKGRAEIGVGYSAMLDRYVQDKTASSTQGAFDDKSKYSIGSVFGKMESYTLNRVMYPTAGYAGSISVQGLYGEESFKSANFPNKDVSGIKDLWIQIKGQYEQYFPLTKWLILGASGEFVFSTRKFSENYTATIIQAPAFEPTTHSRTVFNDAFSANKFIAVGVKPIFKITNSLHLRNETYGFLPYQSIYRKADNTAAYSEPFTTFHYMSELSLVLDILKVASISAFVNYYSAGISQWNFGINIGCLLFNNKFLK